MQGKKALPNSTIAAAAIGGMILLAAGIIVVVLIRDVPTSKTLAGPIAEQSAALPADPPVRPVGGPLWSSAADPTRNETSQQEVEVADGSYAEIVASEQVTAEDTQTDKLPTWRLSKEVWQADKILRAAGWQFESFEDLGEYLPGEYWLSYSRPVDGPQLEVGLMGDDSRMLAVALSGFVGSISSSAEYVEGKRKAWELFVTTAKALIPDVEQAVTESRANAIGRGLWKMWSEGQSFTESGWRVSTRDYQDGYRQRPREEGDWLLTLHLYWH